MTGPVSGAVLLAAYQPVVLRDVQAEHLPKIPEPTGPMADSVVISEAARKLAEKAKPDIVLWGEIRFDPPHHDDPDFPWEIQHQEWMEVVEKVLGPRLPVDGDGAAG